ncbi:MAG: bifunctional oligoribonuclease/PAP phosphatase NrnA [Oscillospiraceae bacterium]|nr:bifunctional oligoribonuclease/PAP phosphatase NrnA [Oscillospiraceae bacterium]MCR5306638.1 bifunctional oligoribonuclease/PAP phosphatase NrnA [Oscillospiraceae bacterium]
MIQTEQGGCREIGSAEALQILRSLRDVYILIHRSPDGDCIGSGYALYHILREMGIRSRVCCADPIPAMFRDITEGITFAEFEPQAFVSVDVADRNLFGDLPERERNAEIALCIDHHISNTHYAKCLHWNPDSAAACEILFRLMQDNGIPLTEQTALCLYTGIATDTGCFQFSNADAAAFRAVAQIKAQFPHLPYARLNRELFVLKSEGRLRLDARLMEHARLSADGRVALVYLPYAWMEELHLSAEEIEGTANLPMQIIGVEVGIICKQQPDGSYRISMRGGEHADVSVIAQHFGGGGHIKASGCSLREGEPEAVCTMLMEAASGFLREQL